MSGTPPPGYSQSPPGGYSQSQPPTPVYAQPLPGYSQPALGHASAGGAFGAPAYANTHGCQKDKAVAITDIVLTVIFSIGLFITSSYSEGDVTVVSVSLGLFEILSIAASICILCCPRQVWPLIFWIVVNSLRFAGAVVVLIVLGLVAVVVPGILIVLIIWLVFFIIWTVVYVTLMILICNHCHSIKRGVPLNNAAGFAPQYQVHATYSTAVVPPSGVHNPPPA